ncbi:DinB family protein [Chitinophaga sp.]|uniref:DinB family protein n=1 Tax=Chitinophaga sp. TaxID=1869181 RepID=UPI0031DDC4E7
MKEDKPNAALHQFNDTITAWITFLNDYTLAQLHKTPAPGSWSLGQVYTHIIDDTRYQVGQMKTALATKENTAATMHPNAQRMFANNSFPDMRIQGPATDQLIPQPTSKNDIEQALIQIKNDVNEAWEAVDPSVATGKSLHPGLLYFSGQEWLQFMEMHLRHHFKQKQRIDEKLSIQVNK